MNDDHVPMFSIVVPCRDDQEHLDHAVASILDQTFDDFEIIVVDDGSSDPVQVERDPRIRVLRRDQPGGPAVARNAAVDAARGRHIAFCDSDDVFLAERLAQAAEAHTAAPLVVCGQGAFSDSHPAPIKRFRRNPLHGTTPHLGATSIRRDLCPRFDDAFLACQDIEWWVRVVQAGLRPAHLHEVGYMVRASDRPRLLNSKAARLEFSYELLDRHAEYFATDRRALAFRWLRIAIMERQAGNESLNRRAVRHSLSARPTAAGAKEAARVALGFPLSAVRRPTPMATKPLAPMSRGRGRALRSLRRGTQESRLRPRPLMVSGVAAMTVKLPRSVRGRLRRAATAAARSGLIACDSAWGTWYVERTSTRLIAPYVDEVLESAVVARLVQPGMTTMDIGANRGWYTLLCAARSGPQGRVIAVEPDTRVLPLLREVVRTNSLETRVCIVEAAVSDSSGSSHLVRPAEAALSHLAVAGEAATASGDLVEVATREMWDVLIHLGIGHVDFVKIDVEGGEHAVLRSLCSAIDRGLAPPCVMFEYEPHHYERAGTSFAQVGELLRPIYRLFQVDYSRGGLEELHSGTEPHGGRNVIALPGDQADAVVMRLGIPEPSSS